MLADRIVSAAGAVLIRETRRGRLCQRSSTLRASCFSTDISTLDGTAAPREL